MQPAIREDQRLQAALQKFLRDARRFADIAAPDAQVAIDHRRVVKHEIFLARGRSIFRDAIEFRLRSDAPPTRRGFAIVAEQAMNCGEAP